MAKPTFVAGDAFQIKSSNSDKLHLYIVLCDPSQGKLTVVAVPLNTLVVMETDTTVILKAGEHRFINRDTSVSYDKMDEVRTELLAELETRNENTPFHDKTFVRDVAVSPELLQKVRDGAMKSDLAPKGVVRELKARLGMA